jgi:hypothetical protein
MADEEVVELVTQARQPVLRRDLADEMAHHVPLVPKLLRLLAGEIETRTHINDRADQAEPQEGQHSEPPR